MDSFEHFMVYPREAIKAEDPVAHDQLVRMAHITNRALFDPRIPQCTITTTSRILTAYSFLVVARDSV